MKAKVYFTRKITPEKVLEMYRLLGCALPGRVAVKLHSGEVGNQNFLGPEFWQPVIEAAEKLGYGTREYELIEIA